MKKFLIVSFLLSLIIPAFSQQVTPETMIKRQKRKGLTIKEWNTQNGSKQARKVSSRFGMIIRESLVKAN